MTHKKMKLLLICSPIQVFLNHLLQSSLQFVPSLPPILLSFTIHLLWIISIHILVAMELLSLLLRQQKHSFEFQVLKGMDYMD